MTYQALTLPAGMYKNGTIRASKGRWYDGNYVRWYEGQLRPWGGWLAHSATSVGTGARAINTWTDNSLTKWIGIGTYAKLYVCNQTGTVSDITPVGLTVGQVDATSGGGYGNGSFGVGTYGTPRQDNTNIIDATVWTLDTFGQYLLGTNAADGHIYEWQLNTATPAAALGGTGVPTANRAVSVTEEGFIFALGANGNPRNIVWGDQRSDSLWVPAATNQAGSFILQTNGRLMCGKRIRGGHLCFTDADVHLATYVPNNSVYGFQRVGSGCGIISQQGAVVVDTTAFWMSRDGFWLYDGYVQPLESEVGDYVFGRLNEGQRSKVFAIHNPSFGEVTWFYPSGTEIDSYVSFNYRENQWSIGSLIRTCGIEATNFSFPLMIDATGAIWEHENGFSYSGSMPYAETGPLEIGDGDRWMTLLSMIPDDRNQGDVNITWKGRPYPDAADTSYGPYVETNPLNLRLSAREWRLRITGVNLTDWRWGPPRLDTRPGARR